MFDNSALGQDDDRVRLREVDKRCATETTVRFSDRRSMAAWTSASDCESNDAVASVQDEDGRMRTKAGDGDALPLAARQGNAAFADPRLVAFGRCVMKSCA